MNDTLLEKKIRIAEGMGDEGWPLDATGSTADYAALEEDLRRQAIDAVQKELACRIELAVKLVDLVLSKTRING